MNTTQKSNNLVEISTDSEHILHRIGSEDYSEIRKIMTLNPSDWEEVAVADIPPYTTEEYNAKVAELIHERYSADRETSLINNMLDGEPTEEHAAEYREYQRFRAECKLRAKDPALYVRDEPEAPDVAPDAAETEDQLPENGESEINHETSQTRI